MQQPDEMPQAEFSVVEGQVIRHDDATARRAGAEPEPVDTNPNHPSLVPIIQANNIPELDGQPRLSISACSP